MSLGIDAVDSLYAGRAGMDWMSVIPVTEEYRRDRLVAEPKADASSPARRLASARFDTVAAAAGRRTSTTHAERPASQASRIYGLGQGGVAHHPVVSWASCSDLLESENFAA
jgi:hypothetical protein